MIYQEDILKNKTASYFENVRNKINHTPTVCNTQENKKLNYRDRMLLQEQAKLDMIKKLSYMNNCGFSDTQTKNQGNILNQLSQIFYDPVLLNRRSYAKNQSGMSANYANCPIRLA
jgi:hypothetical protein